jgi:hypothetical protein
MSVQIPFYVSRTLPSSVEARDCGSCARIQRTAALVTTSSTSPRCAPIRTANLSTTPSRAPRRLLAARVSRKFLTMPSLSAPPRCFCSSWTICCLSETERVGAFRIWVSLASFWKTDESVSSDLAVGSRALVFAAAVNCHAENC